MATDMEFRFTCARVELLLHSLVYSQATVMARSSLLLAHTTTHVDISCAYLSYQLLSKTRHYELQHAYAPTASERQTLVIS